MRRHFLAALAALTLVTPHADAETFVLDASNGADYDSVGDGWFFANPMTQPPPDGIGDSGNNALAVGLISGVLELRAMGEFPLAPLAGLTASQIASATVTITVDDVLSTFGPPANFDNSSSSPMAVYHYVADGTVTPADFAAADDQLGTITPTGITDATLLSTGPQSFTVDATQAIKDALTAGDTHFGILIGTTDSPTGTSLDNLSPPAPVAGGKLPFITIETVALAVPQLNADELACQTAISKTSQKLIGTTLKAFGSCFGALLKDAGPDATVEAATVTKCAAALDPSNAASKVAKAAATLEADVAKKCADITPADVGSPCNASATTFGDVATCLTTTHLAAAQSLVRSQYAGACTLAITAGLDGAYPDLCE